MLNDNPYRTVSAQCATKATSVLLRSPNTGPPASLPLFAGPSLTAGSPRPAARRPTTFPCRARAQSVGRLATACIAYPLGAYAPRYTINQSIPPTSGLNRAFPSPCPNGQTIFRYIEFCASSDASVRTMKVMCSAAKELEQNAPR